MLVGIRRRPRLDGFEARGKPFADTVENWPMDQQPAASHAELSGEDSERFFDSGQSLVEISVVEQKDGSFAAELKSEPLQILGARRRHRLTGARTAREADSGNVR